MKKIHTVVSGKTKLGGEIDCKACFTKTKKKIQEIRLNWFQIRLLHRILATNTMLKEMGLENTECIVLFL